MPTNLNNLKHPLINHQKELKVKTFAEFRISEGNILDVDAKRKVLFEFYNSSETDCALLHTTDLHKPIVKP